MEEGIKAKVHIYFESGKALKNFLYLPQNPQGSFGPSSLFTFSKSIYIHKRESFK